MYYSPLGFDRYTPIVVPLYRRSIAVIRRAMPTNTLKRPDPKGETCKKFLVRVKVSTTRLCKATKDTIWNIVEDLENWPLWADTQSKTHILRHKVLKREGNTALVDEEGMAGGYRIRHTDKYTFYPKDKVTEDVVAGPMSGSWTLTLQETENGTTINWSFDIKPETRMFWLLSLFRGRKILQGVADEYCRQLSDYAQKIETTRQEKELVPA